jgi:hypothetical protein
MTVKAMFPLNFKYIAFAMIVVCAIGFTLRYQDLTHRVDSQAKLIAEYKASAEQTVQQIKAANVSREEYLQLLELSKNEIANLRNRVDAGTTGLRIKASCPKQAPANTAGAETTAPELAADARQDYYALREAIETVNARYNLCVNTLENERK